MAENARLAEYLAQLRGLSEKSGRECGFFIGNTRKGIEGGHVFGPIRESPNLVAGSVLVSHATIAAEIAAGVDGRVDVVFVDAEKKIPKIHWGDDDSGNIELTVRSSMAITPVITYKGNDLTVRSVDAFCARMAGKFEKGMGGLKVAILGAGNLGAKLALSFVERGANVYVYRRNVKKLEAVVEALNIICPEETLSRVYSSATPLAAVRGASIVVGATAGVPVVDTEVVRQMAPDGMIIDVGKGCVFDDAVALARQMKIPVFRADIQPVIAGEIETLMTIDGLASRGFEIEALNGMTFVPAGLVARAGEVVVDNPRFPEKVFGVADGSGDFVEFLSPEQVNSIQMAVSTLAEDTQQ